MTQVVYGQKGYLGSSMSVRAAEAYEQGEMPISRWTKTAIIQAVKDYCFRFRPGLRSGYRKQYESRAR